MVHYLFLDDQGQVIGVWEANDRVSAAQFAVRLSLTYPECRTVADAAPTFEKLKEEYQEYDFGALKPEPVPVGQS